MTSRYVLGLIGEQVVKRLEELEMKPEHMSISFSPSFKGVYVALGRYFDSDEEMEGEAKKYIDKYGGEIEISEPPYPRLQIKGTIREIPVSINVGYMRTE